MDGYKDLFIRGRGGNGVVRICERASDKARFARKTLLDGVNPKAVTRFREEVRILSKLDHPNIVKVIDSQLVSDPHWFVMPLYRTSLLDEINSVIGNQRRISQIFSAILDGVEYAHDRHVIHRDLKPHNVLMNSDEDVVVSDFGIGRLMDSQGDRHTRTGARIGTQDYMSPEQATNAKHVDYRTDIFSLGRILYELETERINSPVQDITRLPPPLARIVERCTRYRREDRFQSVGELKSAWRNAMELQNHNAPLAEAQRLLGELHIAPANLNNADALLSLLADSRSVGDIQREVVPQIPPSTLGLLETHRRSSTAMLITSFIRSIEAAAIGVEESQRIAIACGNFYMSLNDATIRASVLAFMIALGVRLNEYRVMEICAQLLQSPRTRQQENLMMATLHAVPKETRLQAAMWLDLTEMNDTLARLFKE